MFDRRIRPGLASELVLARLLGATDADLEEVVERHFDPDYNLKRAMRILGLKVIDGADSSASDAGAVPASSTGDSS